MPPKKFLGFMYGFYNRGDFTPPEWASSLKDYNWRIRVEGRDKVKKRRFYRYVQKEKLRLAEQGIDQNLIRAVCRYLIKLDPHSGNKMRLMQTYPTMQLLLPFNEMS